MNAQSLHEGLHEGLLTLRRRAVAIGSAAGALYGLLAALALLLLCMWLDLALDLPPGVRTLCGVAALAAGVALLVRLALAARRAGALPAVARRVDEAAGGRGQVLAGVDLLLHQPSYNPGATASATAGTTAGLAQIAVERAAALASKVSAATAAPLRPLARPAGIVAGIFLLVAIVSLAAPRLASTQFLRFADPFGDHPPYSRVVFSVEPGDAKIVYGGGVDIRATAEGGTLESADLVLSQSGGSDEALPMFPEPGGKWRATIANVTEPVRYHVRTRGARSRKYGIEVITVPKLEAVRFRITPPAYTNRPPYEGPLPQGGIAGLAGTKVELWARSNRPLSGGTLEFNPDAAPTTVSATGSAPTSSTRASTQPAAASPSSIALTPASPRAAEASGSFVIGSPGKIRVKVTDVAGQASNDTFAASVTVLPDERPFVRMTEPRPDSFATPDVMLPVALTGEDDYGVTRVQLYRSLNDSRSRPQDIPAPAPPPTRLPAAVGLPLAEYGLKAGDVIKLFARAEDNDPAGPKGSESPVVVVRIISQEQMRRMQLTRDALDVLVSKYEQAARRMEAMDAEIQKLIDQAAKLDPESTLGAEKMKQIREMAEKLQEAADAVKKSAKDDLPFDLDKSLTKQLDDAAKQLDNGASDFEALARQKNLSAEQAKGAMEELRKRLGAQRRQFQKEATEPLEHLEKVFPLKEDEARFVDLYQRQRDLEQRMNSLAAEQQKGGDDPRLKARMRDLEDEQRRLREELKSLVDDVENHASGLPEDKRLDDLRKTARAFADALRRSGATEKMADAEQSLSEFAGKNAHADAKAAADILEQFLSKCQSMGGQASECLKFQPGLEAGLGNTVEQLLEAAGRANGNGTGAGGGYSTRRSTASNVGLYGGRPTRSQAAKGGGGKADRGGSADGRGAAGNPGDPAAFEGSEKLRASGRSDAAVPAKYRKRVGEYFQRVADEIGQ
jgi:hypothetical protein